MINFDKSLDEIGVLFLVERDFSKWYEILKVVCELFLVWLYGRDSLGVVEVGGRG